MIAVILILLFAFICWKKQVHVLGKFDLLLAFGLKLILAFGYFYFYVYISGNGKLEAGNHSIILVNGDFYTFFSESKELHDVFAKSPSDFFKLFFGLDDALATKYLQHTEHWTHVKPGIINDSQNVMRVNALMYFIGQGNVAVHFIFVAALTLFSTHFFVEKFASRTQFSPKKLFWILLLLPSFAFSNASIIKEPFLFSGILLAFGAVVNSEKKTFVQWQFYVGILLMLMFKGYVLLFLFPICGIYLISRVVRLNFKYVISGLTICCILLLIFSSSLQFKLTRTLSEKQYDFMNVARGGVHLTRNDTVFFVPEYQLNQVKFNNEFFVSVKKNLPAFIVQKGKIYPYEKFVFKQADTSIAVFYKNPRANTFFEATPINNSFSQLVLNTPEAFFRAAFCPTFSDIGGWKMKFHFFETLFVFAFVFYFFRKYRKLTTANDRDYQLILIVTAFLLFLLIGYTTPVFGAIIRYRLPAYLFLIIACLLSSKKSSSELNNLAINEETYKDIITAFSYKLTSETIFYWKNTTRRVVEVSIFDNALIHDCKTEYKSGLDREKEREVKEAIIANEKNRKTHLVIPRLSVNDRIEIMNQFILIQTDESKKHSLQTTLNKIIEINQSKNQIDFIKNGFEIGFSMENLTKNTRELNDMWEEFYRTKIKNHVDNWLKDIN